MKKESIIYPLREFQKLQAQHADEPCMFDVYINDGLIFVDYRRTGDAGMSIFYSATATTKERAVNAALDFEQVIANTPVAKIIDAPATNIGPYIGKTIRLEYRGYIYEGQVVSYGYLKLPHGTSVWVGEEVKVIA